jgi:hypothetical protein
MTTEISSPKQQSLPAKTNLKNFSDYQVNGKDGSFTVRILLFDSERLKKFQNGTLEDINKK